MGTTVSLTSNLFGGTVSSGETLLVSAGGVANSWILEPGGSITVLAGGILSGTEQSGGTITVSSGGSAAGTMLETGSGTEIVSAGGTDTNSQLGTLEVMSGGLAIDPLGAIVSSGGIEEVTSGASAGYGTVLDGGLVSVLGGGDLRSYILSAGASLTVAASGTAFETTLDGPVNVSLASGAVIEDTSLNSGATLTISAGVTDSDDSVGLGALELVASGGVASGLGQFQIDAGGSMGVLAGGTAVAPSFGAGVMTVSSGGIVIAPQVYDSSGTLDVLAGGTLDVTGSGTADGVTLLPGAVFSIGPDATLALLTLGSGQTLTVSAGLSDGNGLISGGVVLQSGAAEIVSAGGTAANDTVLAGATQTILAGGSAVTIDIGAVFATFDSATNSYTSAVMSGGVEVVSSGGVAGGSQIRSGIAVAGNTIEYGGEQIISAGGTAIDAVVGTAGTQTVLSGGLAIDTEAQTAFLTTQGGIAVISSGGTLEVLSGQVASGVTLLPGAILITSAGGSVDAATIGSSVTLSLSSGVSEFDTVISAGGLETVGGGHVASGVTVFAGGILTVTSGGLVSGTSLGAVSFTTVSGSLTSAVEAGGLMQVSAGGTADATFIYQGGAEDIFSGGFGSDATVNSGGSLAVGSGGTVISANVESGGMLTVSAGGVWSGGQMGALGASLPTEFGSSGGSAAILGGGLASGIGVYSGAMLDVSAGGTIDGATLGAGTLDLAAGAVVSGSIDLALGVPGSDLIIGGTVMPDVPISNFAYGDTIDLAGIPFGAGGSAVPGAGGTVTVTENGKSYTLDLAAASLGGHALQLAADGSGGTLLEVACFAAGTRLATPAGEAPVESLRPGDAVLALVDGAWVPRRVRWVGRTAVDLASHPRPWQAAPIRIRAGAIANGIPARDVLLSPDHAVFLDGALFQAQALQNGASILQEMPPRIAYVHVELDAHAILSAEGLPAESYLDTGNRAVFAGESGARALHPDLTSARAWDVRACATLHLAGPALAAAHARLLLRAVALGHVLVGDPALRLLADGRNLLTFAGADGTWQATLPAETRELRVLSRQFVPAWFAEPDRRRLGVPVRSVRLAGRRLPVAAFGPGWHAPEPGWRWTDGAGVLRPPRGGRLVLRLAPQLGRYWHAEPPATARDADGVRPRGAGPRTAA